MAGFVLQRLGLVVFVLAVIMCIAMLLFGLAVWWGTATFRKENA